MDVADHVVDFHSEDLAKLRLERPQRAQCAIVGENDLKVRVGQEYVRLQSRERCFEKIQ